jgi:Zn-dependent membrane protease YugP
MSCQGVGNDALDLMEQALPLHGLFAAALLLRLMQLPVSAEDQKNCHLDAEYDSTRGQGSREVLDALVLVFLANALIGIRRLRR